MPIYNRITGREGLEGPVVSGVFHDEESNLLRADRTGIIYYEGKPYCCSQEQVFPHDQKAIRNVAHQAVEWYRQVQREFPEDDPWNSFFESTIFETVADEDEEKNTRFIQGVLQYLPYIKNVFYKPIQHLQIEEVSLSLHRSKKLSTRADAYLASHSEDWQARRITGVMPRKVLSVERYEELDIYENRIAIYLLDRLIEELRKLQETLHSRLMRDDDMNTFGEQLNNGAYHWMAHRVCNTWAGVVLGLKRQTKIAELEKCRALLRQLRGLQSLPLYTEIRFSKSLRFQLRMTNILTNDPNYKYLPKIWALTNDFNKDIDDQAFIEDQIASHKDFYYFALLYAGRAVKNLGDEYLNHQYLNHHPEAGISSFDNGITLGDDGELSIIAGVDGTQVLRIVPIFYEFNESEIKEYAELETEIPTLVLYPKTKLESNCNGSSVPNRNRQISFMQVSPYDVFTIERLAREIRWHIFKYYLSLPRKLSERWMGNLPVSIRTFSNNEGILTNTVRAQSFRDKLRSPQNLQVYLNTMQVNPQNRHEVAFIHQNADDLAKELDILLTGRQKLQRCPVCGETNCQMDYNPLRLECPNCGTVWGEYHCRNGHTYPYIKQANINYILHGQNNYSMAVGQDMLCNFILENGDVTPVCPYCE